MKKFSATIILLTAFLVLTPLFGTEDEKTAWQWLDFSDAQPLALQQNKHLIINFYSIGCYWCRKMDKDTYGNQEIIAYLDSNYIGAKVNNGSNRKVTWREQTLTERELARYFNVRGTPFTAFVDTSGQIVGSAPGYLPPTTFAPLLKYVGGYWYKELTFQEFIASESAIHKTEGKP